MRGFLLFLSLLAGTVFPSCACNTPSIYCPDPEPSCNLRERTYSAIDSLLRQHDCEADLGRMLVATLVNINDFNETSMFGRQLAEYMSTRLTQRDKDVILATIRQDHLLIRDEGQFLLSREVRNLVADHNAKSVIVGTYGITKEYVYVTIRLVSTVDDSILSAVDFAIRRGSGVDEMLAVSARDWR